MKKLTIILTAATIFLTTMAPMSTIADPGDKLYVKGNRVNVRKKPTTAAAILLQVNKGREVMEKSREGDWVEVGITMTGGKTGWIHSSLLDTVSQGNKTAIPPSPEFLKFKEAFETFVESMSGKSSFTFFTQVEDKGDGIIYITASDVWLSGSADARISNLRTIHNIWKAANNNLPVVVYILDQHGNQTMLFRD